MPAETINQTQTPAPQISPSPSVGKKFDFQNLLASFKQKISNLKIPKSSFSFNFPKEKILKIALAIFLLIFVLLLVFLIFQKLTQKKDLVEEVMPTPTPTPAEKVLNPSAYVDDPELVSIQEKVLNLEKDLDEANLNETELKSPTFLDFNVSFK